MNRIIANRIGKIMDRIASAIVMDAALTRKINLLIDKRDALERKINLSGGDTVFEIQERGATQIAINKLYKKRMALEDHMYQL